MTKEQQLHWRMCERSNTSTMLLESQTRVRELTEKTREKICLDCPAKLPAQSGQNGNNPAAPPQHRQKDVFVLRTKHAPQNGCKTTQGRERIRQFMFAAALRTKCKNFPKLLDGESSNGLAVPLNTSRHCSSQCAVQCATTTDAMLHERLLCERLVKTTQKKIFLNLS